MKTHYQKTDKWFLGFLPIRDFKFVYGSTLPHIFIIFSISSQLLEKPTVKMVDDIMDRLHELKIKGVLGEKLINGVREHFIKEDIPKQLEDLLIRMLSCEKKVSFHPGESRVPRLSRRHIDRTQSIFPIPVSIQYPAININHLSYLISIRLSIQ